MFTTLKSKLTLAILAAALMLCSCAPAGLPTGTGATWHLVIIGDSSLWEVGEAYAARIEKDTGVKVILDDFSTSAMSAGNVLSVLRSGESENARMQKLPQALKEAEVVVMFVNPNLSIDPARPLDFDGCFISAAPAECEPAAFERWTEDLKAIWAEILKLRQGKATILRATDLYNPSVSSWKAHGVFEACTRCWLNMSDATRLAAEAYRIPFLGRYAAMNGPDRSEDIVAKGYISDGEHLSPSGAQRVADLLAQMGYQPVTPP